MKDFIFDLQRFDKLKIVCVPENESKDLDEGVTAIPDNWFQNNKTIRGCFHKENKVNYAYEKR